MALWPFHDLPARNVGGLQPSSTNQPTPLSTPRYKPMLVTTTVSAIIRNRHGRYICSRAKLKMLVKQRSTRLEWHWNTRGKLQDSVSWGWDHCDRLSADVDSSLFINKPWGWSCPPWQPRCQDAIWNWHNLKPYLVALGRIAAPSRS